MLASRSWREPQLWGAEEVHALVALFLRARFPVLAVLNKSDAADPAALARLLAAGPAGSRVPCSAIRSDGVVACLQARPLLALLRTPWYPLNSQHRKIIANTSVPTTSNISNLSELTSACVFSCKDRHRYS